MTEQPGIAVRRAAHVRDFPPENCGRVRGNVRRDAKVEPGVKRSLLNEWQDLLEPGVASVNVAASIGVSGRAYRTGGEGSQRQMVIVHGQRQLLQMVDALDAPRCFARGLDRGEQEGDKDPDDRDHHQKLNKSERTAGGASVAHD